MSVETLKQNYQELSPAEQAEFDEIILEKYIYHKLEYKLKEN